MPRQRATSGAPPKADRSTLFVGSVEKAFQVLEAFRESHREMTLAEAARAAGLDRSATQRLVHTLEQLGYLRRLPDTAVYGLAPKVLRLSYNYLRSRELIERASPYLLDISRTLGETTNLQELDGTDIVFLARFPGAHLVNVDFAVGYRLPAAYTASGRAMLAQLAPEQRLQILHDTPARAITPHTETRVAQLAEQLDQVARQGYAVVADQTVIGDISVAAAIADRPGRPLAALNISVPTTRWTLERVVDELVPHVLLAATSIGQRK